MHMDNLQSNLDQYHVYIIPSDNCGWYALEHLITNSNVYFTVDLPSKWISNVIIPF